MRRAALGMAGLLASVGACGGVVPQPRQIGPHKGPVIVASSARCDAQKQGDIALFVGQDAQRLKSLLRAEVVLSDNSGSHGRPTESAIKDAVSRSIDDRGLFVFYSGHGEAHAGHGELDAETSTICVYGEGNDEGVRAPASTLLGVSPDSTPSRAVAPWAVLLLNSCESAFVDLRRAVRPTAVISTAHRAVSASLQGEAMGGEGTVVGRLLAAVLSGDDERTEQDDDPGGPDANCDGMLTDYELFGRLLTELARVYPDTGADPPVLNLRRASRTHIPLPLDGEPRQSKRCMHDGVRERISRFVEQHSGGTGAIGELRDQLANQQKLAAELRTSVEKHRPTPFPQGSHDFFITNPPDPALDLLVGGAGLVRFPGNREEAQLVADYAIFTEVYAFEPDGADRVRVLSLRKTMAPFRADRTAGQRLLRNLRRTELLSFARGLQRRLLVIGESDKGELTLLFTDRVDGTPFEVETSKGPVRIDPQRLRPVPCEEGEGQCFRY